MAISDQISRLQTLRNNIRTKLITLGILPSSSTSATLNDCYTALNNVNGKSSSDLTVSGNTVSVPAGYYPGTASATVPVVTYYTGLTDPDPDVGSEGDIYLKMSSSVS